MYDGHSRYELPKLDAHAEPAIRSRAGVDAHELQGVNWSSGKGLPLARRQRAPAGFLVGESIGDGWALPFWGRISLCVPLSAGSLCGVRPISSHPSDISGRHLAVSTGRDGLQDCRYTSTYHFTVA